MEEPNAVYVNFEIQEQPRQEDIKPGLTNVTSVVVGETNTQVNVNGRISFQGTVETILTKGKLLQKQDALFTDNTGTVRLVLWEKDIVRVTSDSSYKLSNVMVREYDQSKYLSLSKKSIIEKVTDTVEREDDINVDNTLTEVYCPFEAVQSLKDSFLVTNAKARSLLWLEKTSSHAASVD